MTESYQVYHRAIEAVGAKKLAHALDLSLSHTYRLARHPMDSNDPDGTGGRNDLDRFEALGDVLAAHPKTGLPTLALLHGWMEERFSRWLGRANPAPLADSHLATKAGELCREFGELLVEARPGFDADRVVKEASEVIAVLQLLIRSAELSDNVQPLRVQA